LDQVPVDLTGLDFFPDLPASQQAVESAQPDTRWGLDRELVPHTCRDHGP
jgi:hypothetical protein